MSCAEFLPETQTGFILEATVEPTESGVLDEWTLAVKDNIDVGGLQTTGGTRFLTGNTAVADAGVVALARAAGARIVGKTNMHELGHGITGVNATFGTTLHPEDERFTVGGSSGGSALAVVTGKARAALGTDTGGSVRIPAAFTGLVGFRPSQGRYPSSGVLQISPTRDTVGVLARSVEDVIMLDSVLAHTTGSTPNSEHAQVARHKQVSSRRIGVLTEARDGLTAELRHQFEMALKALARSGFEVVEIDVSRQLGVYFELGITVLQAETIDAIHRYLRLAGYSGVEAVNELIAASESPDVREILRSAAKNPPSETQYQKALACLFELGDHYREALARAGVTVIVYPTTSVEPPFVRGMGSESAHSELRDTVLNSTPATLVGTPAVSLPVGRSQATGLPVGITLENLSPGDDARLLDLAADAMQAIAGHYKEMRSTL